MCMRHTKEYASDVIVFQEIWEIKWERKKKWW